jgi:DNA-binding LytR/AlgR family response regulator
VKKTFKFNEAEKEVSLDRLLYIESKLHKLEFHVMEDGMKIYTLYKTLNEISDEFAEYDFIRIHQSFLVNLKYIKKVMRYKVILMNQQELSIPKARYKIVKDTFVAYRGEL